MKNKKINARKIEKALIEINKAIYEAFSNKLDSNKLLKNDFTNIFDYSLFLFEDGEEGLDRKEIVLFEEFEKIFNKHSLEFHTMTITCRITSFFNKISRRSKAHLTIFNDNFDLFKNKYETDLIFNEVIDSVKSFNYLERFMNEKYIDISTFLVFDLFDPDYYEPTNEIHSIEISLTDGYEIIDLF